MKGTTVDLYKSERPEDRNYKNGANGKNQKTKELITNKNENTAGQRDQKLPNSKGTYYLALNVNKLGNSKTFCHKINRILAYY